mgnify:CR=1 FL=1
MRLTSWWWAEISRKLLHVSAAVIPLAYLVLDREVMLWLLWGAVVIAVAVEVLRHAVPAFSERFRRVVGFMIRASEWGRICGATYVLVGALLAIWIFPKWVAIAVLLVLCVSDSAASLIGIRYGRSRFLGKSAAGSLAFFLTALAVLALIFRDALGVAFTGAIVATVAEALPSPRLERFELNDNLMIPLLTGAVLWWLLVATAPSDVAAALLR